MAGKTRNAGIEPDIDAALDYCNTTEERPYLRLWATALRHSVLDVCRVLESGRDPEGKADNKLMAWFWSDSEEPASFVWMCELFDRDPQQTRRRVVGQFQEIVSLETRGKKK